MMCASAVPCPSAPRCSPLLLGSRRSGSGHEVPPSSPPLLWAGRSSQTAVKICVAYALVGAVWILLSDATLIGDGSAPEWQVAQTLKGLAYVGATTAALYLLVRAGCAASERQARQLFLANPSPMWVFDCESLKFITVNEAACEVYGYSQAEFLAMTVADIRPSEGAGALREGLGRLREGRSYVGTVLHRKKNGEALTVRLSAHPLEFGRHRVALVLSQDISQDVAMRDAIKRSEARFHQLLDSLDEVLWMADMQERSLYRSKAHETVLGRPVREFERDPGLWLKCVHPADRDIALETARRLRTEGYAEGEYRIVRPDGTVRWLRDRKRWLYEGGRPVMMGGIAYDITERRTAHIALQQMNETLEAKVRERTAELQAANSDLEAFSYSAAHDLKTPLAGIRGMTQLLEQKCSGALDEQGQLLLGYLDKSARDMATLIDALLGLCKVSRTELQCRPLDLSALALSVLTDIDAKHPLERVRIEVQPDLQTHGDPGLVRSLLMNLLGNAVKYSSKVEAPLVELGQSTNSPSTFWIRDNGAGFEVKDPDRMFKPFQRFHSDRQFEGTGVGLATCKRIVLRHGGDIWLTSAPGRGTTVFFTLGACQSAERSEGG